MKEQLSGHLGQLLISFCVIRHEQVLPQSMVVYHRDILEFNDFDLDDIRQLPDDKMRQIMDLILDCDERLGASQ